MNYFTKEQPFGNFNYNYSKTMQQKNHKPLANDWDLFLFRVRKYREDEFKKYVEDRKVFDKVLDRVERICNEQE